MNVLFLDYDGVVNTPIWEHVPNRGWRCRFNMPQDNKVNDLQAVQWISEFCLKYDYYIVITSTWRSYPNWRECLQNAGLRPGVKIIGKTPSLRDDINAHRGDEIQAWLKDHDDVEHFIIVDDEMDVIPYLDHLIKCHTYVGFKQAEFYRAETMHQRFLYHEKTDKKENDDNA